MRVTLKGFVKNTENSYGVFLNTITVETPNKERIILDRDTTEYDINFDDTVNITLSDVYIWNGESQNYNTSSDMFRKCKLIDYEVKDDVDDEYELIIEKSSICFFD